jgi:hypothetical protein
MRTGIKASQEMIHVARLVVNMYRVTRVLKVSAQKDGTKELNRKHRAFKANVLEFMGLTNCRISESFCEGLFADISYCEVAAINRPELYTKGFSKLVAKCPEKSSEPLSNCGVFD